MDPVFYYNTIEIRNKFREILSAFDIVDLGRSPLNRYSGVRYWRIFIYRVQPKIMDREERIFYVEINRKLVEGKFLLLPRFPHHFLHRCTIFFVALCMRAMRLYSSKEQVRLPNLSFCVLNVRGYIGSSNMLKLLLFLIIVLVIKL